MFPSEIDARVRIVEAELLKFLATPRRDTRLYYVHEQITEAVEPLGIMKLPTSIFMRAVWSLASLGLAYIDYFAGYQQTPPEYWKVGLTSAGIDAAMDAEFSPSTPDRYLQGLRRAVPHISGVVLLYVTESAQSYWRTNYLASAVMLGVASEAAFYEVAGSFRHWLPEPERGKFGAILDSEKSYNAKFNSFRDYLRPRRKQLPPDLQDNLDLFMDSVLNQIRIYRNEAGHPTGKQLPREDADTNLRLFPGYLRRLYGLKSFFDTVECSGANSRLPKTSPAASH